MQPALASQNFSDARLMVCIVLSATPSACSSSRGWTTVVWVQARDRWITLHIYGQIRSNTLSSLEAPLFKRTSRSSPLQALDKHGTAEHQSKCVVQVQCDTLIFMLFSIPGLIGFLHLLIVKIWIHMCLLYKLASLFYDKNWFCFFYLWCQLGSADSKQKQSLEAEKRQWQWDCLPQVVYQVLVGPV